MHVGVSVSVGRLQGKRQILIPSFINFKLVAKVKSLRNVLQHEVEAVFSGDMMKLKGVKAVGMDGGLKLGESWGELSPCERCFDV
jgi:hypothetical protein